MNEKTKKVIKGFLNLSSSEKSEIVNLLKEYDKYPNLTNADLRKAISTESFSESRKSFNNDSTVNFGPRPEGCPCCGR